MGIVNKSENWWLRLSLVLFALITLASASVINRTVTAERQILIDSVKYSNQVIDSLKQECEFKDDLVEILIDECVKILAGDLEDITANQIADALESALANVILKVDPSYKR